MAAGDIPDLVAIEDSWEGSKWTQGLFERELNLPFSLSAVTDVGGRPVGFGVLWMVADLAQLLEFAVALAHRKKGIGPGLLNFLMAEAASRGCVKMELELREGNFPAQKFYEKMGFTVSGRRKKYYDAGGGDLCDAILMERAL